MSDLRACPYCGEEIRVAATRCRYCRSRLTTFDPERWRRDAPDRRLAGVAAATAAGVGVPVGAVRLGFIVLTFFHLLGPLLYGALWLVVPYRPGEESLLATGLGQAQRAVNRLFAVRPEPRPPGADGPTGVPQSPPA